MSAATQKAPGDAPSLAVLRDALVGETAKDTLRRALERYGDKLAIALSFSPEDMIVLHLVRGLVEEGAPAPRLFTLDTGRLPEETQQLLERARHRYRLPIEVYVPDTAAVEELVREKGPLSFYDSVDARKTCCRVRKVEPLQRALASADAWATGLRREQAPSREELPVVDVDAGNGGIVKLNPLAAWREQEVWAFVDEHTIPTSTLHEQGYPSIGCAPCTRAVPGWERGADNGHLDIRAGRWWWETPEQKECGLHVVADAGAK